MKRRIICYVAVILPLMVISINVVGRTSTPTQLTVQQPVCYAPCAVNSHEWVDLGLSVKWATCNLGASSPSEHGNYYAWGETTPKSSYTDSNSKTNGKCLTSIKADPQYDAARANWGGGWRLPTIWEFRELMEKCVWKITNLGCVVTSKINGKSIFLPAAGWYWDTSIECKYDSGKYWSSDGSIFNNNAYALTFSYVGNYFELDDLRYRSMGYSIRPVLD